MIFPSQFCRHCAPIIFLFFSAEFVGGDLIDANFDSVASILVAEFNIDGSHFQVHDEATKLPDNRLVVERQLTADSFGPHVVASSFLKIPTELNETLDTESFAVNHSLIVPFYLEVMAAAPFVTGAIRNDGEQYNVLSVGLGIGILNGFYHEQFPSTKVTVVEPNSDMYEMAKKYFGLVEDERQKVVLADGIDFIQNTSVNGSYDVIFLDGCYSGFVDGISCPVRGFLQKDLIDTMKNALTDKGTLVLSVLAFDSEKIEEITSPFKKAFPECTLFSFPFYVTNKILICGTTVPDEETMYLEMSEVFDEFGFRMPPPLLPPFPFR